MTTPDPRRELTDLLRQCVQCGLCLPHCATWLATGSEVQSPRGRLILLEGVLAGDQPDPASLAALDQCIGCRACETACPSGVPFSLLEMGQAAAQGVAPPLVVPGLILRRLDRPGFLNLLRPLVAGGQDVLRRVAGADWRERLPWPDLARALGTAPRGPGDDAACVALLDGLSGRSGPWCPPPPRPDPDRTLAFFTGCANEGLLPRTSHRLRILLGAAGWEVRIPSDQDCCGAVAAHTGRPGRAARLQRRNRGAFVRSEMIVVEAAGCGLELGRTLGDGGERVVDAVVALASMELPPLAHLDLKVAIHDPCHARHGQGIVAQPRDLLGRIPGVVLCEPDEPEVCCGSGGVWGLRYPEMSADLGRRKAGMLAATGADVVVTSNPGCLGQIADGLAREAPGLPIVPLTDLIWYAAARATVD